MTTKETAMTLPMIGTPVQFCCADDPAPGAIPPGDYAAIVTGHQGGALDLAVVLPGAGPGETAGLHRHPSMARRTGVTRADGTRTGIWWRPLHA